MQASPNTLCSAFVGHHRIASGALRYVVEKLMVELGDDAITAIILDSATSDVIEVDFRGSLADVQARLESRAEPDAEAAADQPRGRGRPKLGVVAREITLLPQHWDWLNQQPGGASVTLRKLVLHAMRANVDHDKQRQAQTAVYRFLTVIAQSLPEYEEALRALYAQDAVRFAALIEHWPQDVKAHTKKLAMAAFPAAVSE